MKHFRLLKETHASGYVQWKVEKRHWFWGWEFVYSSAYEAQALETFKQLQQGTPETKREIIEIT